MDVQRRLSRFSLPTVKNYLVFSSILFFSGFYYYYRIVQTLNTSLKMNEDESHEVENSEVPEDETIVEATLIKKFLIIVQKHRLLFYILLNTCCAFVAFMGIRLVDSFFGRLTNQEDAVLRKYFRRFVQTKLTFLIFISHQNLLEDILCWTPWLAMQVVCLLILELAELRMANTYSVVSNAAIRRRLFAAAATTGLSALLMIFFVFGIKDYIIFNYCLFLSADCCILLIQSIHLLSKLVLLNDAHSQGGNHQQQGSSYYYIDLVYGLVRDCLEFANYLHMIFYSHLALTYCCVFLIIQAQYYYGRISSKIRKHWQQREILHHISNSYGQASEEDLLKNSQCLICWQHMKTARKLPCSHMFHEHCLRRWLEQDSSCAVCRQQLSLNLNNLRQQHQNQNPIMAGDDVGQAMQMIVEIFSPQNNRIARWWSRLIFDSMNEDQINAMVNQVAEMFPQASVEQIRQIVNNTGSVTATVDTLLQGNIANGNQEGGGENAGQVGQNVAGLLGDDGTSSVDGSYVEDSSEEEVESVETNDEIEAEEDVHLVQQQENLAFSSNQQLRNPEVVRPQGFMRTKNDWLNEQMVKMLVENRRRYLHSNKGNDLANSQFRVLYEGSGL